jgi:hypothetical protein
MSGPLSFPQDGYLGVAADFADLYSQHLEPPKEFFYLDMLALTGAALSGRVRVDIALPYQPRLYVNKIARSAWDRKSTSTRLAEQFVRDAFAFNGAGAAGMPEVVLGVGSAEGLAQALLWNKRVVLSCDELRRFEAKAGIQGSALLPMVNELFESNRYQNLTKGQNTKIEDGHFVFVSNSTEETWHGLLNGSEIKDSGFLNRIFLLPGNTNKRISRPTGPATHQIQPLVADLAAKFAALPALNSNGSAPFEVLLPFTSSAETTWDSWYCAVPQLPETARLDTIGPRLMAVLAFVSGKPTIDDDVMRATLALLDFQQQVRVEYAPIIAVNQAASMEEKIRRALKKYGPLNLRKLRRHTNADRVGIQVFWQAMRQLDNFKEIQEVNGKWDLVP